jgi:hypothetical protein
VAHQKGHSVAHGAPQNSRHKNKNFVAHLLMRHRKTFCGAPGTVRHRNRKSYFYGAPPPVRHRIFFNFKQKGGQI